MSAMEIAWFLMMPVSALLFGAISLYATRQQREEVRNTPKRKR
ncbi:MAG: hypothetical protein AAF590_05950 [Pseudomonadota bacterium]